jgi:ATP-dependent RNA helicase DDX5/DBP2
LAPTRELAIQIGEVADKLLGKWSRHGGKGGGKGWGQEESMSSIVLYGGSRREDQLRMLRAQRRTHLMVATPGRILDFITNFNAFQLRLVSFFVLDEGDRMLDCGFEEDIIAISSQIRSDRQMLFFSATWPTEVEKAATRLCSQGALAQKVRAGPEESATEKQDGLSLPPREIQQLVEVLEPAYNEWDGGIRRKLPLLLLHLKDALDGGPNARGKALIFVATRRAAEELGEAVAEHFGLDRCGVMHGLRRQEQRESTLRAFRDGMIKALVATDVLGRGVDIPGVTHVVVFDFPDQLDTYIHRVGRTGRNGSYGTSVAFFELSPWYPDLPIEFAALLRACGQTVPEALALEEELALAARKSGGASWEWQQGILEDEPSRNPNHGMPSPGSWDSYKRTIA